MIIPTLLIEVFRKNGSDAYGQAKLVRSGSEMVCPVKLDFQVRTTSVRTDAAASKARAHEDNAVVIILATIKTKIRLDDKLVIHGHGLGVTDVHPRYRVTGELDHYEIHCSAWV